MMFKQRKNFENNIFWNAQHNLREKGLNAFSEVSKDCRFGELTTEFRGSLQILNLRSKG